MANLDTHAGTWPPVFSPWSTPLSPIIPPAICTCFHHTKLLCHQENEDKGRTLWHWRDQSQMWTIKIKMFIFHMSWCHLVGSSIKFPESEAKFWDFSHLQQNTIVFPNTLELLGYLLHYISRLYSWSLSLGVRLRNLMFKRLHRWLL